MSGATGDTIRRNFGYGLAAQLTSAAFTGVLAIFLARVLDPAGYGVFALAMSIGMLILLPADFGVSSSAARFAAERRGDRDAVAQVIADALVLKIVISGVVAIALFFCAGPLADAFGEDDLTWPLRAIAIAVFGQGLFALFNGAFIASGRNQLQLRLYAGESVAEFSASIGLVLAGAGALGAAAGRAIGYGAGALLGLVLAVRELGRRVIPRHRPAREQRRQILRYAGALLLIDAAFTLFEQVDVLFIGAYLDAEAVGVFQAPMRLVTFIVLIGGAVSNAVAPRLARNEHEAPRVESLNAALRGLTLLGLAVAVPIAVWADPIVTLLLGSEYEDAIPVMRLLAPVVVLGMIAPLATASVTYLGEAARRIPLVIAAVALNAALDVILIPRIGVTGGAISTAVAYAFFVPTHLWLLARLVPLDLRALFVTTARGLIAGGAMALPLLAVGTEDVGVLGWLVGGVGAIVAFLTALRLIGEVTADEVAFVRRLMGTAVRR